MNGRCAHSAHVVIECAVSFFEKEKSIASDFNIPTNHIYPANSPIEHESGNETRKRFIGLLYFVRQTQTRAAKNMCILRNALWPQSSNTEHHEAKCDDCLHKSITHIMILLNTHTYAASLIKPCELLQLMHSRNRLYGLYSAYRKSIPLVFPFVELLAFVHLISLLYDDQRMPAHSDQCMDHMCAKLR